MPQPAPFMHSDSPAQKLPFLEIGRALAALIVVLHHADQASAHFSDSAHPRIAMWGQFGVDFFFVLSGFIIFHAHRGNVSGLHSAQLYVFKRVARIYVPYLPVALGWMALLLVFQSGPPEANGWSVLATLTLAPMQTASALSVAWTLTYEMIFYSFFLLAFVSRPLLYGLGAVWCGYLLWVLTGSAPDLVQPAAQAMSNPIILEFFCGALAAMALPLIQPKWRLLILALGVLGLIAVIVTWTGQRVWLGGPLALIVLGLAMIPHNPAHGALTRGFIFLGAASYAIYLVHSPVISILAQVLQPLDQRPIVFVACVVAGTLAGVVFHLIFEKPVLAWVQRFRPKRAQVQVAGLSR
jgi:exopolysaccharide production protein ExoZ